MTRPLFATALLLVATLSPLAALGPLIAVAVWVPFVAIGLGASALLLLVLRLARRWIVWPSVIAAVAGVAGILFVADRATPLGLFAAPTESVRVLGWIIQSGAEAIRGDVPPITSGVGVGVIVALVVLLLYLAAEGLAVGAQAPALAGVPLLLLWTPHAVLNSAAPVGLLLLAAGAYGVLLTTGIPVARLAPVLPAVVGVTATALAASVVISPWALSQPSWIGGLGVGGTSSTRMDLGLDIRRDLERGRDTPLMTYAGLSPAELGPVHSHTLADFDGQQWHPGPTEALLHTSLLHPERYGHMIDHQAAPQQVRFHIDSLSQDRLFLPESPRLTSQPALYDPFKDELHAPEQGEVTYDLAGPPLITDPHVWHDHSRSEGVPARLEKYLHIPQTSKTAQVHTLAEEITAGATSTYEQAVMIQDYLRTGAQFQYTTSVPDGTSDDAVWDFLEDGRGYCVQYATAMVILARAVGIPARMAVGFLPGDSAPGPEGSSGGVISAHDAHTWPQLFLGDAGWARFEPTPSARAGAVPSYATGLAAPAGPEELEEEMPQPMAPEPEQPTPEPTQEPITSPAPEDEGGASQWWLWALAALTLVGSVLGFVKWRHIARSGRGVEEYWAAALRALRPLGITPLPADTPQRVLTRARAAAPDEGWDEALAGLSHLTEAINASRYAAAPAAVDDADLHRWLTQVRRGSERVSAR